MRINGTLRNDNAGAAYRLWNNNTQTIMSLIGTSTSVAAWRNNTSVTLTNSAAMPSLNYNGIYNLGAYELAGTYPMNGYIQELVIYSSYQTSNRTGIQSNMNSYYSVF